MKRLITSASYICSSIDFSDPDNPFKRDTRISYYNNFLNAEDLSYMEQSKNRTGKIEEMPPNQYFEECANNIFDNMTVASLKRQREVSKSVETNQRLIDEYAANMQKGDKFPLCYLNYADRSQEGLHRMYAAGEAFGWHTKFPVLCVYVYDQGREDEAKLWRNIHEFEIYTLGDYCGEAVSQLTAWDEPVPQNITDLLAQEVVKIAKDLGHTIELECELNDEGQLSFYLLSYEGNELRQVTSAYTYWIQDMFDVTGTKYDTE